ncbi:hypothetical protein [Eshraghiella crossota]|uniref:hypothetical protein n=1 Tax=Eshraghiella crossota TaxID=45851 RepID=UPI003F7DC8D7
MKKKNGGSIVAIVLIAIVVVFSLVTNIRALTGDESDYKTVTLKGAGEFFDMKYSVNYIPTATVHYYYGVSEDVDGIIVFRASKSFYKKNFLSTGYAKGDGVTVKGKIIKLKAKESKMLKEKEDEFTYYLGTDKDKSTYYLGTDKALNVEYKSNAIRGIVLAVFMIILGIVGVISIKKGLTEKKAFMIVFWILVFGAAIYILHLLSYGGLFGI